MANRGVERAVASRRTHRCTTESADSRATNSAWRASSIRFELSLLAEPSTPNPTLTPARRYS